MGSDGLGSGGGSRAGFFFSFAGGRTRGGAWLRGGLPQRGRSGAWSWFCRGSRARDDLHLLAVFQEKLPQSLFFVCLLRHAMIRAECQQDEHCEERNLHPARTRTDCTEISKFQSLLLEKRPADLRQNTCCFGERALAAAVFQIRWQGWCVSFNLNALLVYLNKLSRGNATVRNFFPD